VLYLIVGAGHDNYAREKRKETVRLYRRYEKYIFPYIGGFPVEKCGLSDWIKCFDRMVMTPTY
jgi:hypothetical protein